MSTIKKTICGGMIGLAGLISGCTTAGEAWGRNVVGGLALGAVSTGVNEAVTTEIAGPRASTVNVYQASQAQPQYAQPQQVGAVIGNQGSRQYSGTNGTGLDCIIDRIKKKDGTIEIEKHYGTIYYRDQNWVNMITREGVDYGCYKDSLISVEDN